MGSSCLYIPTFKHFFNLLHTVFIEIVTLLWVAGGDACPAADVAHYMLRVRSLWQTLWKQSFPHGGRRAVLRERFGKFHLKLNTTNLITKG